MHDGAATNRATVKNPSIPWPVTADSSHMSAPTTFFADSTLIDVHDAAEVLRCCEELGVTELELRDAIRNVGPRLGDVKHAIAEDHYIPGEHHYDDLPAEEGGKVWERETAPGPRPD